MPALEWLYKKHDPYLAALNRVIRYMEVVSGLHQGDVPRRDEVVKDLETALAHLINLGNCPACAASRGLQDAELAFLAACAKFSEHAEYRRWLKGQRVNVCYSDGADTQTADDPLSCLAVFINGKRLDAVCLSVHCTAEEMLSEKPRRL